MGNDVDSVVSHAPAARRSLWRPWRVALAAALTPVVLLAALLFAAAHDYLTQPVTHLISDRLGRELAVGEGLRIHLGRVIRVSANGLRLANSAWATHRDMLRARHVEIEIDAASLFRDTLVVRSLTADGLELHLQRNDRGENNWSFRPHSTVPREALPVIFETVSIPGARISLSGPRLERPLELTLASLDQQVDRDGMLALRAMGSANGTLLELQMNAGPLAQLMAARNFSIKTRGRLGEITLGLDTRIDSLAAPANTQLSLSFEAPQAAYLAARLGLRDLGDGPVSLALVVSPAAPGQGVQGRVTGRVGEFDIAAQGSVAVKNGARDFEVQGHVAGPDLSRVGEFVGVRGLPAESFRLQLDAQRTGSELQVRSATLELADARFEAKGALASARTLQGNAVSFKARAADISRLAQRFRFDLPLRGPLDLEGSLRLAQSRELQVDCRGTLNYGNFTALGPIQLTSGGQGTRLAWTASGADIAPLATALGVPDPPRGKFTGKGGLEWTREGLLLRDVRIEAGGESASIAGKLGRPAFGRGADLQLDVSGPSAARMARRFRFAGLPAERYRLAGRFRHVPGRMLLSAVNAELAGGKLALDGAIGEAPDFTATDLRFTIGGPELADYAGLLPKNRMPRGPFHATGRLTRPGKAVLRLDPLQLAVGDALATVSADLGLPMSRHSLRFELEAKVPRPTALFPDSPWAGKFGNQLQLSAAGSREGDTWSVSRLRIDSDRGLLTTAGALVFRPRLASEGTQVELRAPSLKALGSAFDRQWPELPIELHARLSRSEQQLALDALAGRLGGTAFSGHFAARGPQGKPDVDVELNFPQLDLDRLRASPPPAKAAAKPATAAKTDSAGKRVISDSAVTMPQLGTYSGRLAVRADRLRAWGSDLTDFALRATFRDGRLHVDPLAATGPSGSVKLNGTLAPKGHGISIRLAGSGSDLRLRPVPIAFGGPEASRFAASVELQANGDRWSELAATLNGRIRLVGKGGQVKNSLVMASSSGFVKQLLGGLNPMATKQATTNVECAVYLLRARDGVVTTDPAIVMRTPEVDIVSAGVADLRSEKIDFNFKIRARKGLGFGISQLVNPYVKVNGTLARPGVTLDPTGALVNGGAAVATAGLSVVATTLWDRFVHESEPCAAAVAESDRRAAHQAAGPANP